MAIDYFTDDEIIFQIEHLSSLAKSEVASLANHQAGLMDPASFEHPIAEGDVCTVPIRDSDRSFSLVRAQLSGVTDFAGMLSGLFDTITDSSTFTITDSSAPGVEGILRSVSPNWLMNATQHPIGIGGPGAKPVEADVPSGDDWRFAVPTRDGLEVVSESDNGGEGVHVVILDSAPSEDDMKAGFINWNNQSGKPPHPLVDKLLPPNTPGKLSVDWSLNNQLTALRDGRINKHMYKMADHGLFVAGIIKSIAPGANLHLYQVLNDFGIGTLMTIAQGLQFAVDLKKTVGDAPVVVNCSLMLVMPLIRHKDPDFPSKLREPQGTNTAKRRFFSRSLREICEQLDLKRSIVVAAAGNDAKDNNTNASLRPIARFPAAFKSVIGVGALPRLNQRQVTKAAYKAATYSNISDDVPPKGYMTLGGESGGKTKGMRGIFLGGFPSGSAKNPTHEPNYLPNGTGWAWWAGTSFATPVVTGYLARLAVQIAKTVPTPPETITDVARDALDVFIEPLSSPQDEHILFVKQGT